MTTEAAVAIDGVRPPAARRGPCSACPATAAALRRSGLLTEAGLAAVGADKAEPAPLGDPAVGQYVGRRLGREVVDRLVDPLLGGVYAGRADGLSLRATMPALAAALDRDGGKLVAAARSVVDAAPPDAGPAFAALDGGLGVLPEAVAPGLGRRGAAAAADPPDRAHHRRVPARRRPGAGPGDDRRRTRSWWPRRPARRPACWRAWRRGRRTSWPRWSTRASASSRSPSRPRRWPG